MTGAELIVVSCSTLSPTVEEIRPFIHTRIVTIDEAMAHKAVTSATRIGLLVTANSTKIPSQFKLASEAQKAGRAIEVETVHNEAAIQALKAGNREKHDQLVHEMAALLHEPELIVLAQASMAHLEQELAEACGVPVLSSPRLCIEQVKNILSGTQA